jgi:hypothetical protein
MYRSEAEDLYDQLPRIAAPEHIKPVAITGSDSGHYVLAQIDGGAPVVFVSMAQVYETLSFLGVKPINDAPAPAAPTTVAELETQLAAAKAAQYPASPSPAPPTFAPEPATAPPAFGDVVDPSTGHAPVAAPVAAPAALGGVMDPTAPPAPPAPAESIPPTVDPVTGQTVPIPTPEGPTP